MNFFKAIACTLLLLSPLQAQPETELNEAPAKLSHLDAVILGLVEGITEYLPISSSVWRCGRAPAAQWRQS